MPDIDAERPLLLVIRTGHREVREYLLRSISRRYRIHLVLGVEPEWELAYVSGWTYLENTRDPEAVIAAAQAVNCRTPIRGVFCWDETRIVQAAQVAAALGLPGPDPRAVTRCRDKQLTRQALHAAGVPQPRSVRADTVDDALAAAERLGYPVILKPSDLSFSMGVVRADTADELADRFRFTHGVHGGLPGYRATVLVEEYVPGEEISIDAAVRHGRVQPLVLARKRLGYPPYCVEVGHVVDGADPLLGDAEIRDVLSAAHTALGFTDGVTHTEIKLGPGGPRVIEVNGRIGGGLIPYLGLRATGVDSGLAAADVACGRPPDVAADRNLVAGVRFFFPPHEGTVIESIGFDRAALPDGIDRAVVLAQPGETRSPPPSGTVSGRLALAVAVTGTLAECHAALAAAGSALTIRARSDIEIDDEEPSTGDRDRRRSLIV